MSDSPPLKTPTKLALGAAVVALLAFGIWTALSEPLFGLSIAIPAALVIVRVLRGGNTLDGTVLTVRSLLRTRRVDLVEARVSGEIELDPRGTKRLDGVILVAADPATGEQVRLSIGSWSSMMTRPQLTALADAIAAGDLDADDDRRLVVERLRRPYFVPCFFWVDPPGSVPPRYGVAQADPAESE